MIKKLKKYIFIFLALISLIYSGNVNANVTPDSTYLNFANIVGMNGEGGISQTKLSSWYHQHGFTYDLIQTNVYPQKISLTKNDFLDSFSNLQINGTNVNFVSHIRGSLYVSGRNIFKGVGGVNVFMDDIDREVFWRNINCKGLDSTKPVSEDNLPDPDCTNGIDLSFIQQWNDDGLHDDNTKELSALAIMTEKPDDNGVWDLNNNSIYGLILIPSGHIILPDNAFPGEKTYVSRGKWYLPNFKYEETSNGLQYVSRVEHTCKISPTGIEVIDAINGGEIGDISIDPNDPLKLIMNNEGNGGKYFFKIEGTDCDNKDEEVIVDFKKVSISITERKGGIRVDDTIFNRNYLHIDLNGGNKKTLIQSSCKVKPTIYELYVYSKISREFPNEDGKYSTYLKYFNNYIGNDYELNDYELNDFPIGIYKDAGGNRNIEIIDGTLKVDINGNTLKKNPITLEYGFGTALKRNIYTGKYDFDPNGEFLTGSYTSSLNEEEIVKFGMYNIIPHVKLTLDLNDYTTNDPDGFMYDSVTDFQNTGFGITSKDGSIIKIKSIDGECDDKGREITTYSLKPHISMDIGGVASSRPNYNTNHSSVFGKNITTSSTSYGDKKLDKNISKYYIKEEERGIYNLNLRFNLDPTYMGGDYWNWDTTGGLSFIISGYSIQDDSIIEGDNNSTLINLIEYITLLDSSGNIIPPGDFTNFTISQLPSGELHLTLKNPTLGSNLKFRMDKMVNIKVRYE